MSYLTAVGFVNDTPDLRANKYLREIAVLYRFLLRFYFKIKTTENIFQVHAVHSEHESIDSFDITCTYHCRLSYLCSLTEKSSEEEIKNAYVNEVTEVLLRLGNHYGWDIQKILELKAEIVRRNYKFYGAFGACKSSPDRRNTAQVAWTTDDYINIGVNIKNKKSNNEIRVPIVSVTIALGLFETLCKKFLWVDNNTIRIVQKNMRDYWNVDIVQKTSTFHYPRAENGDPHGQYDFAKMYIDGWLVEQDMEKAVIWLEKSAAQGFKRAIRLLERIKSGETNLADPFMNTKKL
jgi:TPR repeat protein